MNLILFLAIRAVLGGLLVVIFALVGEVVKPKGFAGIFGAAPSVALANLALVVAIQGTAKAVIESRAMIGGGVAMVAACTVGVSAVRRFRALAGSGIMALVWLAVAAAARMLVY